MKGRMLEGMRNKARRGELLNHPPRGYVRGPDGDYQLDPDEQAQRVVRLIFDVFEQQGSLHGLLRYLVAHDIRMPIRPHAGLNRGQLVWRPTRMTLQNLLHHPIYAGTPIAGGIARLIRASNSLGDGVPDGPSTSLRRATC